MRRYQLNTTTSSARDSFTRLTTYSAKGSQNERQKQIGTHDRAPRSDQRGGGAGLTVASGAHGLISAAEDSTSLNAIQRENAKPGTKDWMLTKTRQLPGKINKIGVTYDLPGRNREAQ